jgi:hypothetical protein
VETMRKEVGVTISEAKLTSSQAFPRVVSPSITNHSIDVIAILSARKAKSRAQLTTMRTTVAYTRTKHCFMLDYHSIGNASPLSRRILLMSMQSAMF